MSPALPGGVFPPWPGIQFPARPALARVVFFCVFPVFSTFTGTGIAKGLMALRHSIKLIEEIADQIKAKILAGGYQPGERLKQERLAEEFGVSRTPVREALSRLEAQGLVSQPLRRSAVVTKPSVQDVVETFQIRCELEGLAGSLAAEAISDGELARLGAGLDSWRARLDPSLPATSRGQAARQKAWRKFEAEFHGAITAAARNHNLERVLRELMSGAVGAIVSASTGALSVAELTEHLDRHSAIFDALRTRDPQEARRAIVVDVVATGDFVTGWYRTLGTREPTSQK